LDNPADAFSGDAVLTMLADDDAVRTVVLANDALKRAPNKKLVHVVMSTISVAFARELERAHAATGLAFVAAPVFGRPDMAAAAKLFIVPAGDARTIASCKPLFDAMGQKTWPIGAEPSQANLVKLSGNFLIAALIEALGEAIALVGKAGVDRLAYVDLLASTMFPAPSYRIYGELIATGKFEPAAFAAPLGAKDIRLTLSAAESLNVPMPLASLLRDRFVRLAAQGGHELDWAAIGGLAAQDAGEGQLPPVSIHTTG